MSDSLAPLQGKTGGNGARMADASCAHNCGATSAPESDTTNRTNSQPVIFRMRVITVSMCNKPAPKYLILAPH